MIPPLLTVLAAAMLVLSACGGGSSKTAATGGSSGSAPEVTSTTSDPGQPAGSELVPLLDLEVGYCFDSVADTTVSNQAVWKINCADPHTYEVFEVLTYDGEGSARGAAYPGTSTVQDRSEQACYQRFEAFVGVRWTISELDLRVWWPSERSWDNHDRGIVCTVMASDGSRLTGTQRGARR